MALQAAGDLFGVEGVREQEFDAVEAGRPGGAETFQEAQLVEHQAQVGGEAGHAKSLAVR